MRAPTAGRRGGRASLTAATTPMIDVVFLLLVFFLCTASFETPEENLAARLLVTDPAQGSQVVPKIEDELEDIRVVGVRMASGTRWTVNDGPTADDQESLLRLLRSLAQIDATLPVTIDAGPDVPLGDVVTAYDASRDAGLGRVQLAASADATAEATAGETPNPAGATP